MSSAVFTHGGRTLLAAGADGTIRIWCRSGGEGKNVWEEKRIIRTNRKEITDLCLSPDGSLLAFACRRDPRIHLWDVDSGRPVCEWKGHSAWVLAFAFSADNRLLATGSFDYTAKVWDLRGVRAGTKPRLLTTLERQSRAVSKCFFGPYGKTLVTASDEEPIRFWDLVTFDERASVETRQGEIFDMTVSADGRFMATAGGYRIGPIGCVELWPAAARPLREK